MKNTLASLAVGTTLAVGTLGIAPSAEALILNLNGDDYKIRTVTGTFEDNQALLESQPWWVGDLNSTEDLSDDQVAILEDLFFANGEALIAEFGFPNVNEFANEEFGADFTFGPYTAIGFDDFFEEGDVELVGFSFFNDGGELGFFPFPLPILPTETATYLTARAVPEPSSILGLITFGGFMLKMKNRKSKEVS